jgi:hypothetical protein
MKKALIALSVLALAAPSFAQVIIDEDFDSMGTKDTTWNPGDVLPAGFTTNANGAVDTVEQNGGPTDPHWVNWGNPSVGAVNAYNQGMEDEIDRALGLYKTGATENPMYIEVEFVLDSAVDGLNIEFDVEVPMARSNQSEYKTMFDVLVDGTEVGSSGELVNNSNLTGWSWTDASAHYWLNDSEMDAGGLALRDELVTTGPLAAGTHTLRFEIPATDPHYRMHTGLDNLTVSVVPEPATMSLLALGGLGVIRRRRRK